MSPRRGPRAAKSAPGAPQRGPRSRQKRPRSAQSLVKYVLLPPEASKDTYFTCPGALANGLAKSTVYTVFPRAEPSKNTGLAVFLGSKMQPTQRK